MGGGELIRNFKVSHRQQVKSPALSERENRDKDGAPACVVVVSVNVA